MKIVKLLLVVLFSHAVLVSGYAVELDKLLPSERNNIEVFRQASPKVVYVHRMSNVVNRYNELMQIPSGAGSGIVWDAHGHIVTNYHVIYGADNLAVTIGHITVPAKLIGAEPRKDLAVLSVTSPKALALLKTFQPFEIGKTNDLLVGQKVIAIGNPFGFDHSMTTGIISALGRQVPGIGGVKIRDMIQTDASINPGNSGGPLLDSMGQLIGLNTAIYSRSGSSAGVGFAVPADEIKHIADQIIQHGRVLLAGIGIQRVETHTAQHLGIKRGVLIAEVLSNTPAAKSGLQGTRQDAFGHVILGDVIVAFNGHPVKNYDDLYNFLTKVKIGESITLTVLRDGQYKNFKMKTIDILAY